MTTLEEVGFLLFEKPKCLLKNLFGENASIPVNRPMDVDF
jgi:hypothetical protein